MLSASGFPYLSGNRADVRLHFLCLLKVAYTSPFNYFYIGFSMPLWRFTKPFAFQMKRLSDLWLQHIDHCNFLSSCCKRFPNKISEAIHLPVYPPFATAVCYPRQNFTPFTMANDYIVSFY